MRCDNTELASQCGLNTPDLMTPASYVRGQLRWDTVLANCTPELYCVRLYEHTAGQRSDCESQTFWRGTGTLVTP